MMVDIVRFYKTVESFGSTVFVSNLTTKIDMLIDKPVNINILVSTHLTELML